MQEYHFIEAKPLIDFIEKYKESFVGKRLVHFHTNYWPECGRESLSDEPVVLELEEYCIVVRYLVPSDILLTIGKKDELQSIPDVENILTIRDYLEDYFDEEFGWGEKKESIEGCVINSIDVMRFSHEFEYNSPNALTRPDGGDYFSTIRIDLDSGKTLCLCGAPAILDGYVSVWCE